MQPKKILVIQNKRIGDVLIASLIATNIRSAYPDAEITYFVYDFTSGVIEGHPHIHRIIRANDKELKKLPVLLKYIRKIRKAKYDIIFDPYSKFQSRVMCYFSGAPKRIGFRKKKKNSLLNYYTHAVPFLEKKTRICGKAIEDRVHLVTSVYDIPEPVFTPKIYLSEAEKKYDGLNNDGLPVIMFGVLGSTPQKTMPYDYIIELINFVTEEYDARILFNYAPHQKGEALKIYEGCKNQDQIIFDIYEDSIRGFIRLMNQCSMLVANEGGTVHIAKALDKPTFTIFSPYVLREHWGSFEDGKMHTSVHLADEKPELLSLDSKEARRKIEEDPYSIYRELTPEMILKRLRPFLSHHLKTED